MCFLVCNKALIGTFWKIYFVRYSTPMQKQPEMNPGEFVECWNVHEYEVATF